MTNGAEPARPIGTTSAQKTSRVFYGWWVVVASGIGLAFCFGPIIVATFGIFLKPLSHEFGWSRAQISLAFSLAMVAHTVAVPFIGRLADYIGARKVILAGVLLLGVGVFSLSAVSAHRRLRSSMGVLRNLRDYRHCRRGNGPSPLLKSDCALV
jgi:MFS family permease